MPFRTKHLRLPSANHFFGHQCLSVQYVSAQCAAQCPLSGVKWIQRDTPAKIQNSRSRFTLFHHTQTGFTLWTPNHLGDKHFRSRLSKYRSVKWSCWNEIVPKQYLHVFTLGSNQLFTITRKWGYNGIHYSWIKFANINRLFKCRTTCQRLDLLQPKLCRIHLPLHFWVGTSEIRQRILGQLLVVKFSKVSMYRSSVFRLLRSIKSVRFVPTLSKKKLRILY